MAGAVADPCKSHFGYIACGSSISKGVHDTLRVSCDMSTCSGTNTPLPFFIEVLSSGMDFLSLQMSLETVDIPQLRQGSKQQFAVVTEE